MFEYVRISLGHVKNSSLYVQILKQFQKVWVGRAAFYFISSLFSFSYVGEVSVGKESDGEVSVGEVSVREMSVRGMCPIGEVSIEEVSVWGCVRGGMYPSVKCPSGMRPSGKCPRFV